MPPTGAPVRIPTYDEEILLLEGARHIAGTYQGNPRNYEDAWYPFWSQFFRIWTFHIFCHCLPSPQYSVYTQRTASVHKILHQIVFGKISSTAGPPQYTGTGAPNPEPGLPWESALPFEDEQMERSRDIPRSEGLSDKAKGKRPEPVEPEHPIEPEAPATGSAATTTSSAQHTELGSDTTQRIPDTCLVMYHIPKLTHESARALMAERLKVLSQADDQPQVAGPSHAEDTSQAAGPSPNAPASSASQHGPFPPSDSASLRLQLNYWIDRTNSEKAPEDLTHDPIRNAMPAYRAVRLHKGITQFKSVIAEHKGGATRGDLPEDQYQALQTGTMREGQRGSANQGRLYLMQCQNYSSQTEVLLIASVDDNWTHTVLHRVDDGSNQFKVEMDPWSLPVIVGSPNSNARETRLLAWINQRFPHDLSPLVRDSKLRRPEATPESDAGSDHEDGRPERSDNNRAPRGGKGRRGKNRGNGGKDDVESGDKPAVDPSSGHRYNLRKHPNTTTLLEAPSPSTTEGQAPVPRYDLRKHSDMTKPPKELPAPTTEPPRKRRRTAASKEPSMSRKPAESTRSGRASKQSAGRTTRPTNKSAKA